MNSSTASHKAWGMCLVFLCMIFWYPCAANANRLIRVGIFPLGKFQGWDENKNAVGYNIEFLRKISEKTHWRYEYVNCGNWNAAKDMLERGEVDVLAPAQLWPGLSSRFDFAAIPMGVEAAAIYTLADRHDLLYEDFSTMNTLSYGIPEKSTFGKKFIEEYCPDHGISPQLIKEYANTTELQGALARKEVDAIVTNILFAADDYKLLGWHTLLPVYYITRKGDRKLLAELDSAMINMTVETPQFTAELERKYFPIFRDLQFTFEEQEYIRKHPTLTLGFQGGLPPLSYINPATQELSGAIRAILDIIAHEAGIRFIYKGLPAGQITREQLKYRGIQALANKHTLDMNPQNVALTMPYLHSEKVLVAREEFTSEPSRSLSLAMIPGSTTSSAIIAKVLPNVSVTEFTSVRECFDAVQNGRADGTMQNRYIADRQLEDPRYADLKVIPIQSIIDEIVIMLISSDDQQEINNIHILRSILDKSIQRISSEQINNAIIQSTVNSHYRLTLTDVLLKYWQIFTLLAVLGLVIVITLLRSRRLKELKNQELSQKNTQLAEAVAQAERANAAKGLFLSRMSHEIRTPMNAIVGLTTLSQTNLENKEKVSDYLTKIDLSSKVLLNIINDILDMSAIENGKLTLASAEFDLKHVLNSISSIYYVQCKDKGIEFMMAVDIDEELVIGDALRINQILLNLISNAFKFTNAGGRIKILVSTTKETEQTVFIRFQISDTGCGMSSEMLERLFKPFEQASALTAQKYGGSGLGLSIAKNLVDMMHGSIAVESTVNEGSTFTVDVPLGKTAHAGRLNPANFKSMKALIVDDDREARLYTSVVLERIGVQHHMAESAEQAFQMMQEQHTCGSDYNICFIDWKMPGMNGIELTKKIRELFDRRTIVIVVSAYDLSEVEAEAKAAGADMFIAKPLFQSTVFNLLMQLTGGFTKDGQQQAQPAQPDSYDFTGRHVLLAEDNPINTEVAIALLEMAHLTVSHAKDGKEAVDMFLASAAGSYDLILMDVQMPEMDGYEATRSIRASSHPDAAAIPVLAMTANAFTSDISDALSAGMNDHISKPIDTQELYKTIAKFLPRLPRGHKTPE